MKWIRMRNSQMRACSRIDRLVCIAAFVVLTACSGDSDVVRVGNLLLNSVTGSREKIPRERAAAVPYATMGLELGSSAQVLLILGATTGSELEWFAGETVFVATNHGRVIRTVGLPFDLGGVHPANTPSVPETSGLGIASTSYLDFPDLGVFDAPALCSKKNTGDENVDILGAAILTRHIVEHCEVPVLKWTFDNDFWEDRTSGYIWRSRQYVHPKSPPLRLEVLRPEENAAN